MRNLALEHEIAAQSRHLAGPLCYWRTLPALDFIKQTKVVETAVASIVAVSRLAPPDLIAELAAAEADERVPCLNDLAIHFFGLDSMTLGLLYEIGGSCAALSAKCVDPLGLILLLKSLSEPYVLLEPETRIHVAGTWLAEFGSLLNQTTLSQVDWWQSARGYQDEVFAGEDE